MRVLMVPDWGQGNPYQSLLADALRSMGVGVELGPGSPGDLLKRILAGNVDVLHVHWLDSLYRPGSGFCGIARLRSLATSLLGWSVLQLARRAGIRIIWTCHELAPHNMGPSLPLQIILSAMTRFSNQIIVHYKTAKDELVAALSLDPCRIATIPHGNYVDCYPNTVARQAARAELGLPEEAFVFLNFGAISPYKGNTDLILAFQEIQDPGCALVIAGTPMSREEVSRIRQTAAGDARIRIVAERIPNEKVQLYYNACDIGIFPYRRISTSASVVLCKGFGKPCIVPRLGCLCDQVTEFGAFFYETNDRPQLLAAMRRALEAKDGLSAMGAQNREEALKDTWHQVAMQTLEVYRTG